MPADAPRWSVPLPQDGGYGLLVASTLRMETLSQVPNSTKARMAQALDRPRGRTLRDWGTRRAGGRFERCTDRHRHLPDEVLGSRCPVAATEPRCMFAREAVEFNDSRDHTKPVAQSRLTQKRARIAFPYGHCASACSRFCARLIKAKDGSRRSHFARRADRCLAIETTLRRRSGTSRPAAPKCAKRCFYRLQPAQFACARYMARSAGALKA